MFLKKKKKKKKNIKKNITLLLIKNQINPNFDTINIYSSNYHALSFENIHFTDFGKLQNFCFSPAFSQAHSLSFINTNITDEFLIELISTNFHNLSFLDLSLSFRITEKFLIWFFLNEYSKNLESIKLQSLIMKNDGIYALCFSNFCKNIKEIDLSLCLNLNEIAYLNLASSENLANLEKINLSFTKLTCRCLEALALSPYFSNLKELKLSFTDEIKNEGFKILLSSKNWKNLELLDISSSRIEADSLEMLGETNNYPKLKTLIFYDNK